MAIFGRWTAGPWLALGLSGVAVAQPAHAPFTIEAVMSAPYPSSLVAAPSGRIAAWVFNARGVRNIWVGDAAGSPQARAITSYAADDGFDIGELAWAPGGGAIAYTRGATLEDDGPANVVSAAAGPSPREIWVVPVSGGAPRKIGTGRAPKFLPDGGRLIYLDKHQIISADPTGAGQPTPLLTDLGVVDAATWSPDGKLLAFVSQRQGHALIGVYDVARQSITWLAPSFDSDSAPVFSPDGRKLAFIRVRSEKIAPFVTRRAGLPWSIWVADVTTGAVQRIWTADTGPGSVFHPTLSEQNLLWTADNQLVFPWEKTGWLQPYAVPAAGGAAHALDNGEAEVAYMRLTPDGRRLVFASNLGDADRLHIRTVDPAHGTATPATSPGTDIEAFPEAARDGTIFALQSGATHQLAPVVLHGGKWLPLAPGSMPAAFPTTGLVQPQSVTFRASDGMTAHGQLFLPPDGVSRHPAILFFHGGPPRQMLVGFHYMSAYSWMYGLNQYLAAKGYVVLSVNYRGGIGYGLDYREAKDFGPDGGSETGDLLGAVAFLQHRADVDPKRLGIWGGSYGGLMTALGLARASDAIAVGVDYAGVTNWASMFAEAGAPIEDPVARARAIASSPVATMDKWRSPVLVVHADDDRNVPVQQSTELIQELSARGVAHDELLLPNEVHDLTRYASWMTLFEATDRYLSHYLGMGGDKLN
jgi:dipeptidyl aminopeptidase/acylaminoacyl peptidase